MATVLITGASGVLGRAVCDAYEARGDDVHRAFRSAEPGEQSHRLDVTDGPGVSALVDRIAPDVVVHLAAESVVAHAAEHAAETHAVNVGGTHNVIAALRGTGALLLVASSERAYALGSSAPLRETDPLATSGAYAESKAQADSVARESGLAAVSVRASNVYGPGDLRASRLVPSILTSVVDGVPLGMRTDGQPKRDFVYSADVAAAYVALTDALSVDRARLAGRAFNVGTGEGVAVHELARRAAAIAGTELVIERVPPAPDDVSEDRVLDCSQIRAETGWLPATSLDEGLAQTIAWARAALTAA